MAAKIETEIWLAIRSRIETIPLPYEKAWPGEYFEAPYDSNGLSPYLRIGRVSVAPQRMLIENGRTHERTGNLIVTLVHPIAKGVSVSLYDQKAGKISEHFRDGTVMLSPIGFEPSLYLDFANQIYYVHKSICVTVTSYPYVQEGYEDNGYWTVPVSIPWRCFA